MTFEEMIRLITSGEAEINIINGNIKELKATVEDKQRYIDELHETCLKYMKDNGLVKDWGIDSVVVSIRKNPPTVEVSDVSVVPDEYVRTKTTREPDKNKIKEAALKGLKANWFSVKEGTESLIIKGA